MRSLPFIWMTPPPSVVSPAWIWDNIPASRFCRRTSKRFPSRVGKRSIACSSLTPSNIRSKKDARSASIQRPSKPTSTIRQIQIFWPMASGLSPAGSVLGRHYPQPLPTATATITAWSKKRVMTILNTRKRAGPQNRLSGSAPLCRTRRQLCPAGDCRTACLSGP